ncbi:MAG: hypothetical protein QG630_136 [Patescibacteria group bacterium]|nr:hypothetical protein [Patescibacteria group bacterium]
MNFKLKTAVITAISMGALVVASAQTTPSCFQFTQNMKLGSSGAQVLQLQKSLNSMGFTIATAGVGSAGMETSYFGGLTKQAVMKYQAANGVINTGNVFGLTRAALNASCAPGTGTGNGNGNGTGSTSGPLSVSLSSMQPNTVLVSGSARAKLADLTFSGSGSVVSVKLMRTGVSNNSTLSNVYLYDAATGARLTDAASVLTDGTITFNSSMGIFSAPRTVSVLADIAGSTSGQSVGVSLIGYTAYGSAAAIVSGVNGPNLSISSATLASASFGSVTPSNTSINAGSSGSTVWSSALNVGTRAVKLSSMTFKMIGSAPMDALANVKLYVDGTQFANASAFAANGYVTFYSMSPLSLTTGSHTFDVRADIVKGSSRSFYVTLENAGDIALEDSQLTGANVTVTLTGSPSTFPASAGTITISGGSLTISQNSAFTTSSVVGGSTSQTLGSFKFYAYGEDVKVQYLVLNVASTSAVTPSNTAKLNNVTVYVNGGAVSSGIQATLGANNTISLGSNLIIPAGSSAIVEVKGDLVNENSANVTAGGFKASVVSSGSTAQGQYSFNTITVPAATGQTVSVNSGNVSFGATSGFTAANISKNQNGVKIGSFSLQAGSAEAINVTNINVILGGTATPATNYTNLRITDGSQTVVPATGSNNFSVNYDVLAGQTKTIEVWVDTLEITNSSTTIASSTVTYRGRVSGVTATVSATAPTMTAASASVGTPTLVSGSTLSARVLVGGKSINSVATYNVVSTNGSATIKDLAFTVSGSQAGTVESLTIGNVTASVIGTTANFYGINLAVSSGPSGLDIPVTVKYAPVTAANQGGISSGATSSLTLSSMTYTAGGTETTVTPSVAANTMTLTASVPTLSVNSTQATGLIIGAENKVGEYTVTADAAGQIRVATTTFTLTSSGISTSTYSGARIADGNTTVSGSSCSVSSTTVTCALGNYVLSAGQSKTFSLFATVSGTAQSSVTISVSSALSAAGFNWDDNTGGSALSGSSIYNFPTNSYSIRQ